MLRNNFLKLTEEYKFNNDNRLKNLLWLFFVNAPGSTISDWDLNQNYLLQKIGTNIDNLGYKDPKTLNTLMKNFQASIDERLDYSEFAWIEQDNRRQFEFIKKLIIEHSINGKYGRIANFSVTALKGKDLLISNFDIALVGKNRKAELLAKTKYLWNKTIENDQIFSWYKKDLERKLDVTWDWLCKYEKETINGMRPPSSVEDVKIIFDRISQDSEGKELRLLKIKRRLNQSKYHQSRKVEKEPLYIEIDKNIKKLLIEAADASGLSMKEIVESLIAKHLNRSVPSQNTNSTNVASEKFGNL